MKHNFRVILVLVITLIGYGQLLSTENGFSITNSNTQHLSLSYKVSGWSMETEDTPAGKYEKLMVPGYLWKTEVGKPSLPMLRRIIQVPVGAVPVIITKNLSSELIDMKQMGLIHQIIPVQPEYAKIDTKESMIFHVNHDYYNKSILPSDMSNYKKTADDMFKVTELGFMRGIRLVAIDFLPFMYNPITQQLLLSKEVDLDISFIGGNHDAQIAMDKRYFSPAYEPVFKSFVINYDEISQKNTLLRVPMTYLILCPPDWTSAIQPFADWKRREGYRVTIKSVGLGADIENNSTAIKNWLQQSWNNATPENPAYSYVLIVGDTPQITWSATYEYRNSGVWYQTDRNYFLLQGGDSIPEMYWGRFSATSIAQLQAIISKTIQYQQMKMPDNSYLARAALIAGPDYDQGIPQNTPVTNNQVQYATSYFNVANGFNTSSWYSPESHNAASAIVSRINQGNALISYTGHGLENRWDGPVISSTGSNQDKHGIVIGNACLTSTINSTTSYGESWLRSGTGGAIAYIGASCYSIWTPDFYWSVGTHGMTYSPGGDGVYDALFHNQGQPYQQWAGSVGAMVFIGNMAVMAGDSSWSSYYWAIYNIVGDPSTIPYMGIPQSNPAQFPDYLVEGVDQFLNISGAAPGTLVSLCSIGQPVSGVTDELGSLQLDLSSFEQPERLHLTLSAHNVQPILTQINILSAAANPIVLDYGKTGAMDKVVLPGEEFSIDLSILNLGAQQTELLQLLLSSSDPYLQILQGSGSIGPMGINQEEDFSSLFNLRVSPFAPNNYQLVASLSIGGWQPQQITFTVNRPPSLPWVALEEDFESGQSDGTPLVGWSQVQVSGTNQWLATNGAGSEGSNCARLQGIASAWAYKQVELTEGRPYKLRFRYRTTTSTANNYRIQFCASDNPPTTSTTWGTELYNAIVASTSWQLYNGSTTFTPPISGTYYIGFRGNLINHSSNFIYVDDINFLYEEDLSVLSISISQQDIIAGENLSVTASIRNNSIAVSNKVVSLLVSGNPIDTFTIASLAPNASVNVSFNITSPAGQNTYQVTVPIDTNTANNQQSTAYYSFPASYSIQSFEDSMNAPEGWNLQSPWSIKNTTVNRYHGNNYAVMDNGGIAHTDKRISTPILFRQATDIIRFYYKTYGSPNSRLQFSQDGQNWITLRQLTNVGNQWTKHELSASELPAPHTGIWYFAICTTTSSGTHYTFMDKIILEQADVSTPSLQINPISLNFGNVPLETISGIHSITLTNTGGGTLLITDVSLLDQFIGFELLPFSLPLALYGQDSCEVQLIFNASIQGAIDTNLQVESSLGNHEVELNAYGWQQPTLACYTSEIVFPDVTVGNVATYEVVFFNAGDGFLTLHAGDIKFPLNNRLRYSQVFGLQDPNTYPLSLSHMQQASITVSFSPLDWITYSDGLVFENNNLILLTIPVTGTGISAALDTPQLLFEEIEGQLYLLWHPVPNAVSYQIEYSVYPGTGFAPLINPNYYLEEGVYKMPIVAETRGFYRVRAQD